METANTASSQKRAVIITAPGFQDEEYIYPYYRLLEAGFQVEVATAGGVVVHGKYGVPARATFDTKNLKEEAFDLVLLPGGHEAPDRVRLDKAVLGFVRAMDHKGKLVAAICHGPWILISAKVVKGRHLTGYVAIADDLINAGALYEDAPVVVDENLVTAPHYRNNGEWMKAVLQQFEQRQVV